MINFKVGIMGAGKIAGTIADTLNQLDAFEPYAIASRDLDKANAFGDQYSIEKRYGSYEELTKDPDVELIYIATPHSHHAELAKMCINAGKPVLVEKAFSYNVATTEEVLKLSEDAGVFCGEAMWIRYMPIYKYLVENIKNGLIGNVISITCSLGYDLRAKERVIKPELAGGALLDLGVYPINLFYMLFDGEPVSISGVCAHLETGVDAQETIQLNFPNGHIGSTFITMMYQPDNQVKIYGSKGYIELDNINCPTSLKVYQNDHKLVSDINVSSDKQISGYEYEFLAARNAIIVGQCETPEMPHAETLRIMKLMDTLRNNWKVKFPMEQ